MRTLIFLYLKVAVVLWNIKVTAAVTYGSACTANALWKVATRTCNGLLREELSQVINYVSLVTEKENENYEKRGEAMIVAGEAWDEFALNHMKQLFCNETNRVRGTRRARFFSRESDMFAINKVVPRVWVTYAPSRPHHREKAESILKRLGFKNNQVKFVCFGEKDDAFTHREWIAQYVFSDGLKNTLAQAVNGNYLSTFTAFRFLHDLSKSKLQYGLYLEDDARPVFQFKEKFDALYRDLESTKPDWDIVFLGTCLNLHNTASLDPRRESRDLLYAERNNGTRCFNAVMMKRHVARTVLGHGAWSETYLPIDHLFNKIIDQRSYRSIWAQPPLFYEESKAVAVLC